MTDGQATGSHDARLRRSGAILLAAGVMSRSFLSIPTELKRLESALVKYHFETINRKARRPMGARLLIARDLRRAIFVAIAHRLALTIAGTTLQLLHSAWMPNSVAPGLAGPVHDELVGARGRRFVGDEGRIGNVLLGQLTAARDDLFAQMSADERTALVEGMRECTLRVSRLARLTYFEEFGRGAWQPQFVADPWRTDMDENPSHRARLLTYFAFRLSPDISVSLRGSDLGQAEHLCVAVADAYRALAQAGCPPSERMAAGLAHVDLLSDLASLRDEVGHRVIAGPQGQPRPILYSARQRVGYHWFLQPVIPPLTALANERAGRESRPVHTAFGAAPPPDHQALKREPHGRCPSVDVLESHSDDHRGILLDLLRLVDAASGGRCPDSFRSRGLSAANVSAIAAVTTTELLRQRGLVSLEDRPAASVVGR